MSRVLIVLTIVLAVAVTQAAPEGTFLTVDLDETAASIDLDEAVPPASTPELPAPTAATGVLSREDHGSSGRLGWCDIFRPPTALA